MTEPTPAPAPATAPCAPTVPPPILSARDKSAKKEDEIFGLNIDIDSRDLRTLLAPPGVSDATARDLGETMLDAVALPGKTGQNNEGDDTALNIQESLSEIALLKHQEQLDDEVRRDLKWSNTNRNALRNVRNETDLREMLGDVLGLADRAMRQVVAQQKTILLCQPWEDAMIEVWSFGGYVSVISRNSLEHYKALLQHLMQVATNQSWSMAKFEMDYYVRNMTLIRQNSNSRLLAMCRLYVLLRDGNDSSWRAPKLEAEKLRDLYHKVETMTLQGGGSNLTICTRCGTGLHGTHPCPYSELTAARAKKAGRDALRRLAQIVSTEAAEG